MITPLDFARQKKGLPQAKEIGALVSSVYLDKDRPSPRIWACLLVLIQELHLVRVIYKNSDDCAERGDLIPQG